MAAIAASEAVVRIAVFVAVFGLLAIFELWSPRLERGEMAGALKSRRWLTNLGLVVASSALLRLVFPAAAVGAAAFAEARGLGIFRALDVPPWLAGIVSFVVLDFAVWLEHVASHKLAPLWRIHRMHHADLGFDVSTGLRFHPLEILLSMIWKAAIVVGLGAPLAAVLAFEIVLNSSAMFSHSNIGLPQGVDAVLRRLVVTPDMHRVHHSSLGRETDSNYGFNFSIWDRLFGTYIAEPKAGQKGIELGLKAYRSADPYRFLWALGLPFRRS